MTRTYDIQVGGVDGTTNVQLECDHAQVALDFLARYDHEGSVVTVTVTYHDPEKGYEQLELYAMAESGRLP